MVAERPAAVRRESPGAGARAPARTGSLRLLFASVGTPRAFRLFAPVTRSTPVLAKTGNSVPWRLPVPWSTRRSGRQARPQDGPSAERSRPSAGGGREAGGGRPA